MLRGEARAVSQSVAIANAVTITALVPVALYQLHVLQSLPDPPSPVFDSESIASSAAAHPFGIPDATLGIASFGATLALAVAAKESTGARRLLAFKLVGDAAFATFNLVRQPVQFRKLCSWCTAAALGALGAAALGAPFIRGELRRLK